MPDIAVAPVATPAAAAPSTPTPSTPSTPVVTTPAVQTPAEATPVTTSAVQVPSAEPKAEDYANDPTGLEFTKAHFKWQDEQLGVEPEGDAVAEETPAVEEPAEVVAEEPPAEELAEPQDLPDEPESLTPELLNELLKGNEALKTAVEADPKVKGALFEMARQNAKAKGLMAIFPNEETAKFANETANRTVAIKSAFLQAAEDPGQIGTAFDKFVDEFREYDDKGQPMSDAQGNPVLGKDFEMLANHMVTNYFDGEMSDLEEGLKAGKFTSDRAKENAETLLQAYKFIKAAKDADPAEFDRPDTSQMTEEQKSYFDKRDAELKQREEEAGLRNKTETTQARQAARTQANQQASRQVAQEVGSRITEIVAELKAARVNIPDFALNAINPTTKVSYFAQSVYDQFITEAKANPKLTHDLAILEAKPPSEETTKQRVEYLRQFREERLPVIVKREVAKIQKSLRTEREAQKTKSDTARANVGVEPRTGSAPKPTTMTWEKAAEQAKAEVAKETEGKYLTDGDRYELEMKKVLKKMG